MRQPSRRATDIPESLLMRLLTLPRGHWQTDCLAEPTRKFESITRRAPPTEKDAVLAPDPVRKVWLTLSSAAAHTFGHSGGTLNSAAGSTSRTVASLAMISSPG